MSANRPTLVSVLVCMAFVCSMGRYAIALDTHPDDFIQDGVAELAKVARARSDESESTQHALVDGVRYFLAEYADVYTAARLILSSSWVDATPEQRDRFVAAYNNHVTHLLVEFVPDIDFQSVKIDAFDGDLEEVPIMIQATFRTSDYKTVHFVLVIHQREGRWQIFDVIAEGVSYVKINRNQLRVEISRNGLEAAIRRFERRTAL